MLLSLWLPAGLWLYLAWRIVRSGRQGRGLAWVRHALSMAGRQFRVHLVRLGFGAKVCLHPIACLISGVSCHFKSSSLMVCIDLPDMLDSQLGGAALETYD